ncbi:MAG: hypothetical protein ACRD8O_10910 [Bryobacteraceae bacterium]
MRTIAALCGLICAAPLWLSGETSEDRGKRIVNDALAALGGNRFLAMKDRVEAGRAYSFYNEQLAGLARAKIYTRYLTRPDPPVSGFMGVRERQAFGKNEDSYVLFNETGGFEVTFRGARPFDAEALGRFKESTLRNVLYIFRMRLGEPGLIFEGRGTDVVDNQPVETVDITDSGNRVVTVHFHKTTKLPVMQTTIRRDLKTNGRHEEVTLFAKYRDVGGGVMWPFQMQRQRDGEKIFEIFSESVVIDQDLKDNLFTIPGNVKVLSRKK